MAKQHDPKTPQRIAGRAGSVDRNRIWLTRAGGGDAASHENVPECAGDGMRVAAIAEAKTGLSRERFNSLSLLLNCIGRLLMQISLKADHGIFQRERLKGKCGFPLTFEEDDPLRLARRSMPDAEVRRIEPQTEVLRLYCGKILARFNSKFYFERQRPRSELPLFVAHERSVVGPEFETCLSQRQRQCRFSSAGFADEQ
jgi:hypothetical protein